MSQRRSAWRRIGTFALIAAWFVVDGLKHQTEPKPKPKPLPEPETKLE